MADEKPTIQAQAEQHLKSETGQKQSPNHKKFNYAKYMLLRKIPVRFGMILVPEVIVSVLLYALVKAKIITAVYRPLHIIVLLGFWALNGYLAKINRHRTHKLRHYYICNLSAYALFLLVAYIAFLFNYHSPDFPRDIIYYPCFRLSYILALLPTKKVDVNMLPFSMGVFYTVTLAVIILEPTASKIKRMFLGRLW